MKKYAEIFFSIVVILNVIIVSNANREWQLFFIGLLPIGVCLYFIIAICNKVKYTVGFLDVLFLLFITWSFLSFFWAVHPYAIWLASINYLMLYSLFVAARLWWKSDTIKENMQYGFGAIIVISFMFLSIYWGESFLQKGFIDISDTGRMTHYFSKNNNTIASILCLLFPIFFIRKVKKLIYSPLFYSIIAIDLVFLILCNSRSILLVIPFQLFCIAYIYGINIKKQLPYVSFLILILGLVFVVALGDPIQFFQKFDLSRSFDTDSGDERLRMWWKVLSSMKDNWLLGYGSNNYFIETGKEISDFRFSENTGRYFTHAHNIFIQTLFELGLIGFMLLVSIFIFPIIKALRSNQKTVKIFGIVHITFFILSCFYGVTYTPSEIINIAQIIWILSLAYIMQYEGSKNFIGTLTRGWMTLLFGCFIFLGSMISTKYIYNDYLFLSFKEQKKRKKWKQSIKTLDKMNSEFIFFKYHRRSPVDAHYAYVNNKLKRNKKYVDYMKSTLALHPYRIKFIEEIALYYKRTRKVKKALDYRKRIFQINRTYQSNNIILADFAIAQKDKNLYFEIDKAFDEFNEHFYGLYREEIWTLNNEGSILYWIKTCKEKDQIDELSEKANLTFY